MRAQGRVITAGEFVLDEIVDDDGGQLPAGRWSTGLYVATDDKGGVAPVLEAQRIEGGVIVLSFDRPDDEAAEELLRRYVTGEIKAAELKKDARELLGL